MSDNDTQTYQDYYTGVNFFRREPVTLTGECKRVTSQGVTTEYVRVKGLLYNRWVKRSHIIQFLKKKTEYYDEGE